MPERPGAEERKLVTVVFADLVGFTVRSERSTRRTSRSALRVPRERRGDLERFGGPSRSSSATP